jgi:zinc protease
MILINKLTVSALAVLAVSISTVNAQKPTDVIALDKSVKMGKLPNGLTYYIRRNVKPEGKVDLHLAVNAGSVLEREDQQGVAHFLEHMAFNGTKNFPKNELTNYLQKAGVRFGADLNAHTGFDETVYDLPISSKDEKVLNNGYQVIRDWAGNCLLESSEIDKERGIILEEKRMRQGAGMRMMTEYFPKLLNGSMYGKRIPIGKEEVIKTAPRKAFADFYRDWYRPNNMAVIVVGDIDVIKAEAKVKALFSDLKNPPNAPVRPVRTPIEWHKTNKAFVITDKENTSNTVQIFVGLNKSEDPTKWSSYQAYTLNNLLGSLVQNRLQDCSLKASSPIGFGNINYDGSGMFRGYKSLALIASVKEDAAAAINTIVGEALKAKKFGFTAAELERVKKETLEELNDRAAEKDKTESGNFAEEYINNFLEKEPAPGIEAEKNFVENYFKTLTLAQVNAAVAAINLNEPSFVLYTSTEGNKNLPTETALLAAYDAAKKQNVEPYTEKAVATELMDAMPTPGKIVSKTDNADYNSKTLILSNGIKVIYKKTDYKNDEILIRGYQWGGNTNLSEAELKTGKGLLVTSQLGVGSHNSSEMQKMMAGVNASINVSVGENSLNVNGTSTVKDFEKCMQLLHLRFTNLNFDKEEMEGLRSAFKQQLGMLKNNPSFKFGDSLNKYRYGFSKRVTGLPDAEELDALNFDEVKSLYEKVTSNLNGLTLVFVGNVDDAIIQKLAEQYIASIPTKATPTISLNAQNMLRPILGKNIFVMKGGKENKSEIRYTYYGNIANWDDKENMAYGLAADVLQMKTTDKLREEMGSTYSPRVSGQMQRSPISEYALSLSVSAAPENVDKLTAAFDGLVAALAAGGVTDEDLLKAREQRKKSIETQLKTNGYWAQIMEQQDMYGFSTSLVNTYLTRLAAITKEDLVAAAKKYLTSTNVLKAVLNPDK